MSPRREQIAYRPGVTLIHRLHPLVKLGWMVAVTVCAFAVRSPWAALSVLCGLCGLWLWLAPGRVRGVRLAVITSTALAIVQMLFRTEGTVWVQLGWLRLTTAGISTGVYVGARFLGIVLLSYLFVRTTDPNALAYALMQVGLPYRFGFALVTALRLVPVFEQEGETVYRAQIARGMAYDRTGPRRWLILARQFILPLLVSALSKVDALAVSMEGRGFGQYQRRTFLREVPFTRTDILATGALLLALATLVLGLRLKVPGTF